MYPMYWGSWVLSAVQIPRGLREHWASRTKLKLSFERLSGRWTSVWTSVLVVISQGYSFFTFIFGVENLLLFSMSIWNNMFYLHSVYMYVFPIYFYHFFFEFIIVSLAIFKTRKLHYCFKFWMLIKFDFSSQKGLSWSLHLQPPFWK